MNDGRRGPRRHPKRHGISVFRRPGTGNVEQRPQRLGSRRDCATRTACLPLDVHPFTWTRTTICHPTLRGRRTASRDRQACCHDGNMTPLSCVKLTVMLPPRRVQRLRPL
ncbi:hypothetical protein TcG_09296 [Trypanosoma cruzi]|nr:hypothetical protein TcG_09296 [Trypanosoma cruzi]